MARWRNTAGFFSLRLLISEVGSARYLFITDDALLNTPRTALVILGAATATAIAINANMIAYSTTVTPFTFFFGPLLLTIHAS